MSKEHKYFDSGIGTVNYDTTGSRVDLAIIPTGTSVTTRVGKQIQLDSVQIRGTITAGTSSKENCATYLIYDREPNAAAALPAVTDILVSATSNALTNRDNAPRFKIVRKWNHTVVGSAGIASGDDSAVQSVDEFVKLGSKYPIKWQAANTDGATASKVKGNLIFMTLGNNANGAATPTGAFSWRVNYSDQ